MKYLTAVERCRSKASGLSKIAHLLCVIGLSAPLVLEASEADSPARAGSSAEAAGMTHAAASTAPRRDSASTKVAGRSQAQESIRAKSGNGLKAGSAAAVATSRRNSGAAPRRVGPSRPTGPTRAAASALTAPTREQRGMSPVVPPKLSVSNNAVRTLPNLKVAPRGSTIGGPHVAGPGRLGGPATGRTANPAVIDGTQVHRKF